MSGLSRDAYIKESRLFMCILNNSDSGRFLCVNAYFGASIHLILLLFQIMVNKKHGKQKSGIYERHFLYAQLKFVGLK